VVAALPTLKLVTPELKSVAVVLVDVISADVGPLTAKSPLITPLLLIVVVPDALPIVTAVAAPPIFNPVALVLKREAVPVTLVERTPVDAEISPPNVATPAPKKEKVGLVDALPSATFGEPV